MLFKSSLKNVTLTGSVMFERLRILKVTPAKPRPEGIPCSAGVMAVVWVRTSNSSAFPSVWELREGSSHLHTKLSFFFFLKSLRPVLFSLDFFRYWEVA